jgi:adenine-specific DNA-methyltransferase
VFNSRPRSAAAMRELLAAITSPVIIVSFNNEGFLSRDELEAMLAGLWGGTGQVAIIENDFKRYVGAQIGIHNLDGEKVGRVSHLRNKEFLYIASQKQVRFRVSDRAGGAGAPA